MTLKNVLLILFAIFLVSIILFILWEKKGVKKSFLLKVKVIDALFSTFYLLIIPAIIVLLFLTLGEETNPENFLYFFTAFLSSFSITISPTLLADNLYKQSRKLKGMKFKNVRFRRVPYPIEDFLVWGTLGIHLFLYFMLGFVLDVPTYMTMESLPVDVFLFFLFSITVIVIGYLTKLSHDTYRYFSNINPLLIFCSFWFLGKNMNNLMKLNLATFFIFIGIMAVAIVVYGLFQSNYFDNNPYLYKKEKGPISKIILTINASIIGIEVFIIVVYIIALIINLITGTL